MLLLILSSLAFDSILNQPWLEHAHVGMIVLDLDSDSVVYARNCQKLLVPASNTKIVTSAAALMFLGQDFRFKTRLGIDGQLRSGKLRGDVFVSGGGDPGFSLDDLEQFVSALKKRGIMNIEGNIILDDSYFTDERLPVGWAWHYLDARYAAEVSALSINRNVVNVRMEATSIGKPANVMIEPSTGYVELVSEMITKSGDDSIIIFRRPESNIIYVDGGIGFGHRRDIEVSVKNPTMYFGEYLKERLMASNVRISGRCIANDGLAINRTNPGYDVVDSVLSAPLLEIIGELNSESINLYGEAILKTLGSHYLRDGSFRGGVSIVKEFLRRCGVDTSLVELYDGSGLSRHNLISPYDIALVLRRMYHSDMFDTFYNLLPGPGEGTLAGRFSGLQGSLRAKTGTLHAVSCLSGYLSNDGRYYCFSIMFNNFVSPRKQIEKTQEDLLRELWIFLKEGR
ncbi:MAG: D-alanyl-D-alanine carboxypeptidase/D-alanyl-D-alanine-endopeptidase [candidate division WOR-3 bacterium]|nr:MAG: D-alanyl-D-alanine carboxypeptidase/D-alanyl-D-alanine-endopeptidase [candidate division WOR-3 bacterium]